MRAFEGQSSDNRPVKRSQPEKRRQLAELRQTLSAMKSHAAPALRASITAKIAALETELGERRG